MGRVRRFPCLKTLYLSHLLDIYFRQSRMIMARLTSQETINHSISTRMLEGFLWNSRRWTEAVEAVFLRKEASFHTLHSLLTLSSIEMVRPVFSVLSAV